MDARGAASPEGRVRPEDGRRAAVAPRATSADCPDALDVVDVVAQLLATSDGVAIVGGPGSGRTTALRHLVALRPDLTVLDTPRTLPDEERHVVYSADRALRPRDGVARLAPWSADDAIEYLLARHPERCSTVMERLLAAPDRERLGGAAELWRSVLVAFARDGSLRAVGTALRRLVAGGATRLRRHPAVDALCWADAIVADPTLLARIWTADVIREVARDATAVEAAARLVAQRSWVEEAMAASVLHAAGAWEPSSYTWETSLRNRRFTRGHFAGADWSGLDVLGTTLFHADLAGADLSRCALDGVDLTSASLRNARLAGASLRRAKCDHGDLTGADLTGAQADRSSFRHALLADADLRGAHLRSAEFVEADLRRAVVADADLLGAVLRGARVAGADFRGATLDNAVLSGLDLRRARLSGATLCSAFLLWSNLERLSMPEADFTGAHLNDSLLTGSSMPGACFDGADLRRTRLAHVSWPGATLRGANLAGASFHLGSSRSGKVGSVVAGEGSRTGFYTDESREMHFRAPEDMRKANLRGADLRGARVQETDFYLVDLRDVRCTSDQRRHFARCGAILG